MKNVIVLSSALLLSQGLEAAEIGRDILDGEPGNHSVIELGFSTQILQVPLLGLNDQDPEDSGGVELHAELGLQLQLEYNGFFLDVIKEGFSMEEGFGDITLGYNVYTNRNTSLDLVATQVFHEIARDEYTGFESVDDRDEDVHIGVRSSHYFGNFQLQLDVSRDVSGAHDGVVAAAQVGRRLQLRNSSIHGLAGVRYFSEDIMQHYFGVSDSESTATLASYDADDGFFPTAQIGATFPIGKKWIFRTSAEYSILPDAVSDSPLAQGNDVFFVGAGIYRVFQPW